MLSAQQLSYCTTERMGWMAHRKWKEAKQLPGTAGPGNMLGCCLIYFHFLWAIHPIRPVVSDHHGQLDSKSTSCFAQLRIKSRAIPLYSYSPKRRSLLPRARGGGMVNELLAGPFPLSLSPLFNLTCHRRRPFFIRTPIESRGGTIPEESRLTIPVLGELCH